ERHSGEGSSLERARYLVSGIAPGSNLTTTSTGGEGTTAAAPDRFEDNGRARGLFEIRFAQVKRKAPAAGRPARARSGARHVTRLKGTTLRRRCPSRRGSTER